MASRRPPPFAPCVFIPRGHRENLPAGAAVYDVSSSYADEPYCTLSPMWPHGGVPEPGPCRRARRQPDATPG